MAIIDVILNYRRYLKRSNYSSHTIKNYINTLKHFVMWVDVPIEHVTHKKLVLYIEYLLNKRLSPKTINCHLNSICGFYNYLIDEEQINMVNPVKRGYALRLPKPLPRYLRDEDVVMFFRVITKIRDKAIFMLMLRCGIRVEEVAKLTVDALNLPRRQILVKGKGGKDRMVYVSDDTLKTLGRYMKARPSWRAKSLFLVEKGTYKGKALSVRGIQKRMEYYARKSGIKASCHQLRHTMATQMLNADADLVTIQDLLGHSRIKTTERYCKVSNLKVQRDYYKAMETIIQRTL